MINKIFSFVDAIFARNNVSLIKDILEIEKKCIKLYQDIDETYNEISNGTFKEPAEKLKNYAFSLQKQVLQIITTMTEESSFCSGNYTQIKTLHKKIQECKNMMDGLYIDDTIGLE